MTTDSPVAFEASDMREVVGFGMAKAAANKVYEAAGVAPGDIDVVELHDCFAHNELISYEALGLCPEGEAKETLDTYGKNGTLEKISERYADWAPEMTGLLRQGDLDGLRQWTLYELPVGFKWEHRKGFTLIGDAASLATPFSGEGVNKAMKDSLELAELIEKSQHPNTDLTLDQAVLRYEQLMFPRAEKFQATTMINKQIMFGPDAPIGLMTRMLKLKASESPSILMRMLGSAPVVAAVYSYFWIRKQIGWAVRRFWRRT